MKNIKERINNIGRELAQRAPIIILSAIVGAIMALGANHFLSDKPFLRQGFEDKQRMYFASNALPAASSAGNPDFVQAAAAVIPAVVHIKTIYKGQERSEWDPLNDMFDEFFGYRRRRMPIQPVRASGSGVIIAQDGYIVTNNHVVEDATDINVTLTDKRSFKAKVIGRDANTDLALIKINATKLPIVPFGNSDDAQVGEWVLAVGYPLTLNTTVTAGIISAKGRSIGILNQPRGESHDQHGRPQVSTAIESFLQTDAAINRGNSGGALINTKGQLLGINAAIASENGSYEGYGFAIPINLAKKVLDDFFQYGTVRRGYMGINFRELDADVAKELGIKQINGLYINEVLPNSGAEKAGLKKGDIIIKADGKDVYASSDLQERVARLRPGDKIQITYLRNDKERSVSVTLKEGDRSKQQEESLSNESAEELYNRLGASFEPASAALKRKYNIKSGVVVTEVRGGGFFDEFDIPQGTIITSINGRAINKLEDIDGALKVLKNNMIRIDGISPDGARVSFNFQVGK